MKVGDMVQYVDHASWENGGLGVIIDINMPSPRISNVQVIWLDDIEDHGWNEAISDWAQWYDNTDFEEDIKLFAGVV